MKKGKEKMSKKEIQKLFYKTNPSGGISLIVLVITIIVIIILAAAVIVSIVNNNPLSEANRARYQSDRQNMQSIFTNAVGKIMAEKQESIKIEPGKLNEVTSGVSKTIGVATYKIESSNESGTITFDDKKNTQTEYYTGKQLPIYKAGETKWYVDNQGILMLKIGEKIYGEEIEGAEGEEGEKVEVSKDEFNALKLRVTQLEEENARLKSELEIANNKIKELEIGAGEIATTAKKFTDKDGKVAVVPVGFAIVPGKDVIKDGLVISDVANDTGNTGNQFVWVPVDDMSAFKREAGYYNGSIQNTNNWYIDIIKCEEPYRSATLSQRQEYENMINSVREYKGFYIGRYEMSKSEDGLEKAQSKQNKAPWVNIKWGNSVIEHGGGIVEKARTMYPDRSEIKKGEVISTLVYGVAWDETVRFIKTNYTDIEKDSRQHGNYSTAVASTMINTGSKNEYALNNIYDMAGNVWEATMEIYDSAYCVHRGGNFYNTGLSYPISCRSSTTVTDSNDNLGGRVQLYIK